MFNGWMELSVDRQVITRQAVYSLATPKNSRASLAIGSGPPGRVSVRNPDGSLVASASIGATPSFIEPWTFAQGQTVQTERAGIERGNVTVTMYDVPPDVVRSATIGGPAAAIAVEQPGQNATVSFSGAANEPVAVNVSGNTIGAVKIRVVSDDGRELSAIVSSAASFVLPPFALASAALHSVVVDPAGTAVGTLNLSIAPARGR